MGGRIARGWRLAKMSLSVVRRDAALVALSVLGLLVAGLLALVAVIPATIALDNNQDVLGWVLLAVALYVGYFVISFVGVAIALAAAKVLDGEDATVGAAVGGAMGRIGPIAGWSLVGAALNIVFALLRDRGGIAGAILAGIGSAAWSLVSFLAIPVIAFEALGPIAALKRSAGLFRERWGEQITGSVSIHAVFFLLSLPAGALIFLGIAAGSTALAVVGVVAVVAVFVVARAASATFGTVLYRFAATGETAEPFHRDDLATVAQRRG